MCLGVLQSALGLLCMTMFWLHHLCVYGESIAVIVYPVDVSACVIGRVCILRVKVVAC